MTLEFTDWHGRFYAQDDDRLRFYEAPLQVRDVLGPLYDFHARLPWDSDIEEASRRYPKHAEMLENWRDVWDANFPDWRETSDRQLADERNRPIALNRAPVDDIAATHVEFLRKGLDEGGPLRWIHANHLMSLAALADDTRSPGSLEDEVTHDPYIEVLRSAQAILAFRHLRPHISAVSAGGEKYLLVGFDEAGQPRFLPTRKLPGFRSSDVNRAFNDVYNLSFRLPELWRIPDLDEFRHGLVIGTHGGGEGSDSAADASDSLNLLSAVVADMAAQGISEVTITETHLGLYRNAPRRWHVDVAGCSDPVAARRRLTAAIPDQGTWMVTVAPRFQSEHRQRFFVHDATLIGSAAADPDAPPRLDERVFDDMVFDVKAGCQVESPGMALNLERAASQVVAILAGHGVRDYALDLDISGSEIVIGGIFPLVAADTYSFDVANLMRHVSLEANKTIEAIEEAATSVGREFGQYASFLPKLVSAVTPEQMARLLLVACYGRGSFGSDLITKELRNGMQVLLWAVHCSVDGGLFSQEEISTLCIKPPSGSVINDWLMGYGSVEGANFVTETCQSIAARKGMSLSPMD
jgi:hypothetical protein